MKFYIRSYNVLFGLLCFVYASMQAQTFKLKEPVRGDIQWQSSSDAIHWIDISEANNSELNDVDLENEQFFRVKIIDGSCAPLYSQAYKTGESALSPVSFEQVELTGQFWTKRMQTQKNRLVPIAFDRTRSAVEDLRRTAEYLKGNPTPLPSSIRYVISDLFKVMEGAAYLLKMERDINLEKQMDDIIQIIAEAQEEDGYLYPLHTVGTGGEGTGEKPYSWVVHSHELYNMGHLYEAAAAYFQATGKRNLLVIAEKNAKHVNKVFFEGDPKYNGGQPVNQAPGHEEIELALIKLYRITHNTLYLEMAKKFIDIRGVTYKPAGSGIMAPEYAQQHLPVREQTEAVGHAVRATYLYSAMADVSNATNDKTLHPALMAIWNDIVNTRMHITGGLGAVHGIEGFGPQYVLPNANAFDETCAAVGNVFTNYRLFLMEKDGKYMDVAEIALLNNALAGVNLDGDRFFYVNPLEHNGVSPFNQGVNGRFEWFGTACCPTNIARLVPQVAGMMYAHTDNEIYCSFYASSKVDVPLRNGKVGLVQTTAYPFDGAVSLTVHPSQNGQTFALKMRIPTWAQSQFAPGELYTYAGNLSPQWELKVNGNILTPEIEKGFISISRSWQENDQVELAMSMPVRFVHASDKVEADRGRVAVTRGPLVYCAEGIDNANDVFSCFIDDTTAGTTTSTISSGLMNGIVQIHLPAKSINQNSVNNAELKLIPYYAWNNRGASKMRVWMPETEDLARKDYYVAPNFIENITASHTNGGESVNAIVDGILPWASGDESIPRWTTWPQTGVNQWLEFNFNRPVDIANVGIYWFDDGGGVKLPASWNLQYYEDNTWKDFPIVENSYPVHWDEFNRVNSGTHIKALKMRVNITAQAGSAIGILELQIKEATGIIRYATASYTWHENDVTSVCDNLYPSKSDDETIPRWTSWPQTGTAQWIRLHLIE